MTLPWNEPPHAVRVVDLRDDGLMNSAITADARSFVLDLNGCRTLDDLLQRLNNTFEFPYPARGFDAVTDLLVDPSRPPAPAYWIEVVGADGASTEVVAMLANIAPFVAERSRTAGPAYIWEFVTVVARAVVLSEVERANDKLARHASREWAVNASGPVPLIVQ